MSLLQLCCRYLFILVTSFILTANATTSGATTYYVAPDGNDSNPGTLEQPWRHIQFAVDKIQAGDTVYVRGGIYHEEVRISNSGEAGRPLRVMAYPDELPVIDGEYRLPDGEPIKCDSSADQTRCSVSTALVRIPGSYVEFDGFKVTRSRGVGIAIRAARGNEHVTIRNCQVHETRNGAINGARIDHFVVEGCDVYHAGNVVPYSRPTSVYDWSPVVSAGDSQNIVYRSNRIHENWGEGLAAGVNARNVLIEDNEIFDNFALQLYVNRVQNVVIQRNLIYHTDNPDFRRGGNPSQCIVINNEIVDDVSMLVEHVTIKNNVITGCKANIAIWGGQSDEFSVSHIRILRNTLVDTHTNTEVEGYGLDISPRATLDDVIVRHNIIVQFDGNVGNAPATTSLVFGHNLWSHVPPAAMQGEGDIVADPQLTAPENVLVPGEVDIDWFKPQLASPAALHNIGPYEYLDQRRESTYATDQQRSVPSISK